LAGLGGEGFFDENGQKITISTMTEILDTNIARLYEQIRRVLLEARNGAYRAVHAHMVSAHWEIGRLIVEEEQAGKSRADYGTRLLKGLAEKFGTDFGKGFDERELRKIRQFYLLFPIRDALRPELSWTHYRCLLRVRTDEARQWYMHEAANEQWGTRALDRQINAFYYERLAASAEKQGVRAEAHGHTLALPSAVAEFAKDPLILEFLNLRPNPNLYEKNLEQAIVDHLQAFMLEMGKGFAFVARQQCIRTDSDAFYIDLVFYNYRLKCFVLLDLKMGKLTHQDIGQMDFYIRYYEDRKRGTDDNPTIGIILCSEKDEAIVKYSVLKESEQLFATRYLLLLPTEAELAALLREEVAHFRLMQGLKNDGLDAD
jgi:predicted nuclease of restriction endonuclease-like (RecB) superfamily